MEVTNGSRQRMRTNRRAFQVEGDYQVGHEVGHYLSSGILMLSISAAETPLFPNVWKFQLVLLMKVYIFIQTKSHTPRNCEPIWRHLQQHTSTTDRADLGPNPTRKQRPSDDDFRRNISSRDQPTVKNDWSASEPNTKVGHMAEWKF